jgi:hypothetical protein
MSNPTGQNAEVLFDKALEVADKHLDAALAEAGPLSDYVTVAMIETAVNRAVDVAGHEDIADMLRDLANQIEADMGDEADNDNDEDEEEDEDEK